MKRLFIFVVLWFILLTACTPAPVEPTKVAGVVAEPPTKVVDAPLSSLLLDTKTNIPKPTKTSPTKTVEPTMTAEASKTPTETQTATPEALVITPEGVTGVKKEFLFDGNLTVNKEAGEIFYAQFLDAWAKNKQNSDFFTKLLGPNPDGAKFLAYLKSHNEVLPKGTYLPRKGDYPGLVELGTYSPIDQDITLDTIKVVVFGPKQWKENTSGIQDYINSMISKPGSKTSLISDGSEALEYFGWTIDPTDNRLVLAAGSQSSVKDCTGCTAPGLASGTLGGYDGSFNPIRDARLATALVMIQNKVLENYTEKGFTAGVYDPILGKTMIVMPDDIDNMFGKNGSLFDVVTP